MSSLWVQHVQKVKQKHGCTFKDAMKLASNEWRQQKGAGVGSSKLSKVAPSTPATTPDITPRLQNPIDIQAEIVDSWIEHTGYKFHPKFNTFTNKDLKMFNDAIVHFERIITHAKQTHTNEELEHYITLLGHAKEVIRWCYYHRK